MNMGIPIVFSPITELPPQNQPIFTGTGDPGQPLSVVQTYTSLLLGQTVIDENGSWLVRCNQPLQSGPFEVTAYSDLNQGYAAAVPFYVGTPAAQQPNTPTTDNTPVLTSMTVVDSLRPLLTGWAPANATVVIDHSGGSPRYGRVVADSNGFWEHIPIIDLAIDANNWADIAMMALDGAGNALSPWGGGNVDGDCHVIGGPGQHTNPHQFHHRQLETPDTYRHGGAQCHRGYRPCRRKPLLRVYHR